jgi:phosphate transport system substrate-binding protein
MKKKIMAIITSMAVLTSCFIGFLQPISATAATAAQQLSGTVKLSGSTALLPIMKQAAEDFMKANPNVNVTVAGGGSGTGLQQIADGVVDIGNSDVFAAAGSTLSDHQIALEPFCFIVNSKVSVSNLTTEQLVGIMSGKITNWKEVGGNDQKIAVIMRAASSGTRMTIQSLVMKTEQFTTNGVVQDSTGAVRTTVANTPGAIGYVDFAYINSTVKAISYNGVAPTIENVKNSKYTLTSIGHMYTKGEAAGTAKAFIDYVMSPTFQNRVLPFYKFVSLGNGSIKVKKVQIQSNGKKVERPNTKKKKTK